MKILSLIMCIQNLVKFRPCILKIVRKSKILILIKGHNSFANLLKMILYNPNVDLVTDVYTKFGLILSIHSQDIEQKLNYHGMTERERE